VRNVLGSVFALALVAMPATSNGAPQSSGLPYAISAPRPEYPLQAFRTRRTGTAILVIDVDPATGKVGRVQLRRSTGSRQLDRLALRTATKWLFQPRTVTRLGVSVRFSPEGVVVGQDLVPDRPIPFTGTVTAADARAKTITVRGARGTDVISVAPETKFTRNGRPASLADVKVGSSVRGTARVTSAPRAVAVSVEIE
jgi:TonB family protein